MGETWNVGLALAEEIAAEHPGVLRCGGRPDGRITTVGLDCSDGVWVRPESIRSALAVAGAAGVPAEPHFAQWLAEAAEGGGFTCV